MDDKFKIRLKIDNEEYPMTIRRCEEEDYRAAARRIDSKLNKYRRVFPNLNAEKHWLMVAVELAYENVRLEKRNDTQPYIDKLRELSREVEEYTRPSGSNVGV